MKMHGTEYYFHKKNKMAIINSKVGTILPELINRNLKLAERLKDKLKVSSFFNNIEKRNKQYLTNFIFSSNKRIKDLKTGIQIEQVIKKSSDIMSIVCNKMDDDILIKNFEQLKKEKKLVCENTEEETHSKIDELLYKMKSLIKKPNTMKIEVKTNNDNSYQKKEINEIKEYIGNKIKNEEKTTDDKITNYLKKLNYIFKNYEFNEKTDEIQKETENEENKKNNYKRKRDISKLSDNFYIKNNLQLINYTKPKPYQLKDKEGANMQRIKDCLYPSLLRRLNIKKEEMDNFNQSEPSFQTHSFLNKNSSITSINSNLSSKIKEVDKIDDELENINTFKKDSLEVLNMLSTQNKSLTQRFQKKSKKLNSLIDMNLPNLKNYELLLNYWKKEKEKTPRLSQYSSFKINSKNLESKNEGNVDIFHLSKNIKKRLIGLKEDIKNKKFNYDIFDLIFKSYTGFKTSRNNKSELIKIKKNLDINKILKHKASMDDIQQKKIESVFVTTKKQKDTEINNELKKVRSSSVKVKYNDS